MFSIIPTEYRQTQFGNVRELNVQGMIPNRYWGAITHRELDEDISQYIQDGIEAAPTDGTLFTFPPGLYICTGIRWDGITSNKTNILAYGSGWNTHFKKPDDADLTTAEKKRSSVFSALDGSGFILANMWVEGNYSRGGTKPPFGVRWTTSTSYAYPYSATLSTKADGTQGNNSDLYLALGARMFLVLKAHTSDATNILNDVAAGNVVEVTAVWDELTQTGYLPGADTDADYAHRHVVYFHGENDSIVDCQYINVKATDQVYGSLMFGSGPIYAPGYGAGAERCKTVNCFASGSIGGAHNRFCTHIAPTTSGGRSSGIRLDEGSHDSTIIAPLVLDGSSLVNGGVNLYKSYRCQVIAPRVRDTTLAIWIEQCVDYRLVSPDVDGNTIAINSSTPLNTLYYDARPPKVQTSAKLLDEGDSGQTFNNYGATALVTFTLPTARAGFMFTFVVLDTDAIKVVASAGDTIRVGGSVSAAAGNIQSANIGDTVALIAIDFTQWVAVNYTGTWTVT